MRPRICYVLSLLRIHSPDCKHCMARLICGDELRKRLEELNGRTQQSAARFRAEDLKLTGAFRRTG